MAVIASVLVAILVLSAVHLLPRLRNPFAETTTVTSQPVQNTEEMLTSMLTSLGFKQITVTFGSAPER